MSRSSRTRVELWLVVSALALAPALAASAQQASTSVMKAIAAEEAGRHAEAIAAYREALRGGDVSFAVLGLERNFDALQMSDSILPLLDSLLAKDPGDEILHGVQLRVLRGLQRPEQARRSFEEWVRQAPKDPAPYRDYSQMLVRDGQLALADTILARARVALGAAEGLTLGVAQMRAARGEWELAAAAWREALVESPYLQQAALFSLAPAAAAARPAVSAALLADPPVVSARSLIANLQLTWGVPAAAWEALSSLRPDSAGVQAWLDFADRAEASSVWGPARDALVAALAQRPAPALTARAALASLNAGDPAGAVAIAERGSRVPDSAAVASSILPVQVRALAALGKPDAANTLIQSYNKWLPAATRATLMPQVAWGWAMVGELDRARTALAAAGTGADDTEVAGWLALYSGDLAAARTGLRAGRTVSPAAVAALAVISRTTSDTAPDIGRGFLALARGDTAAAATAFEAAMGASPDAGPPLAAMAARLWAVRADTTRSLTLWTRILAQNADAPEAAEADLEWARILRRRGDRDAAVTRLEHLILTFPESALVPQARREMDLARSGIPPA